MYTYTFNLVIESVMLVNVGFIVIQQVISQGIFWFYITTVHLMLCSAFSRLST